MIAAADAVRKDNDGVALRRSLRLRQTKRAAGSERASMSGDECLRSMPMRFAQVIIDQTGDDYAFRLPEFQYQLVGGSNSVQCLSRPGGSNRAVHVADGARAEKPKNLEFSPRIVELYG